MQPQNSGLIFLRLLLNKYFTGKPDTLSKILPKEDAESLHEIKLTSAEPNLMLFEPKEWLSSIDPTWLMPVVQKMQEPLQEVYKKAFPNVFGERSKELPAASSYNDTVQDFLITYLHTAWTENSCPPKALLPTWELTPLLDMSRSDILDIADLLAMYDLVEEMRHIVDKKLLQAVLQYLTTEQQHYLRILLRQKSRQMPTTLSVRELLKEGNKFPQRLHRLGLQRLSLALSGASDDFTWHILHTLDLSRAKFLQNNIKKEEVPNQTALALLQVQHIIQFLKTETAP
ncbi:MAG: hypothetical protein LLF94_04735 [Chlamydiales bacterium]|nr:hypothetical protein [Chlamydiales bacterium]